MTTLSSMPDHVKTHVSVIFAASSSRLLPRGPCISSDHKQKQEREVNLLLFSPVLYHMFCLSCVGPILGPILSPCTFHSFFFLFCLFRVAPEAYGGSQARGLIGAVAASLPYSHSNARSKPCLRPAPQLRQHWILNLLSKARDQL